MARYRVAGIGRDGPRPAVSAVRGRQLVARRAAAVGIALLATLVAGCQTAGEGPVEDPVGTTKKPVKLTFMAYGPDEEVAAYEKTVKRFNDANETVKVSLVAAESEAEVVKRVAGEDPPDIYLLSRRDLGTVMEQGLNQPVEELLDARGISFGDDYKRDAIAAFSGDSKVQCMPYGVSPMVIYFNTALIDWAAMRDEGLDAPRSYSFWTFDQFAEAARFAASRPGAKGVHIEPTLEGVAPFIYSGGGELFDDPKEPTTLTLSQEDSLAALGTVLDVLRDNKITLTPKQLRQESALERFTTGKLGMIAGYRNLVPLLRSTPSLNFDVIPMPTLDSERTIGDVSGLCMAAEPASVSAAADFIVHAISAESVAEVAEAGYLVPANNEVAESEAFLQRDQFPAHAEVFNRSIRDIVTPPALESWATLDEALHDQLHALFYARVLEDLQAAAEEIDETSRTVLSPPEDETTESPGAGEESTGPDEGDESPSATATSESPGGE